METIKHIPPKKGASMLSDGARNRFFQLYMSMWDIKRVVNYMVHSYKGVDYVFACENESFSLVGEFKRYGSMCYNKGEFSVRGSAFRFGAPGTCGGIVYSLSQTYGLVVEPISDGQLRQAVLDDFLTCRKSIISNVAPMIESIQ